MNMTETTATPFESKCQNAAALYLERRGYEILEQNWSCPAGSFDIIALNEDEDCIVFIEVKSRRGFGSGFPVEVNTKEVIDRRERIAIAYMAEHPFIDIRMRFDVISIVAVGDDRACVRHEINCTA